MTRRTLTLFAAAAAVSTGLFVGGPQALATLGVGGVNPPVPGPSDKPLLPPAGDDDVWACAYVDIRPSIGACVYNPLDIN